MQQICDVAVIGGGPVGMMVASQLARHGINVRVFDRAEDHASPANSPILHVRTQELLENIDLAEAINARAYMLDAMSLHLFGHALGRLQLHGHDSPYSEPRTLDARAIRHLLQDRLDDLGVPIERGAVVHALKREADHVCLHIQHQDGSLEATRARYVIGADGRSSKTREAAGITLHPDAEGGFEFTAVDAHLRWSYPSGRGYCFVTQDRFLLLFPLDGDGFYRVFSTVRATPNGVSNEPSVGEIQSQIRTIIDPVARLNNARRPSRWHGTPAIADRFREGAIFLAGEAAHIHVPASGQGLNAGFGDAINLAWKLAAVIKGEAKPAILETYGIERRTYAQEINHHADRSFRQMVQPSDLTDLASRLLGASLIGQQAAHDRLRRVLGDIAPSYAGGPMTHDLGGSIGPIAGDCLADGIIVEGSTYRTCRLSQALHDQNWSLLVFAGTNPDRQGHIPDPAALLDPIVDQFGHLVTAILITTDCKPPSGWAHRVLHDREALLHDRYGVRDPVCYLIRPDRYIALRAPLKKIEDVRSYLHQWLVAR